NSSIASSPMTRTSGGPAPPQPYVPSDNLLVTSPVRPSVTEGSCRSATRQPLHALDASRQPVHEQAEVRAIGDRPIALRHPLLCALQIANHAPRWKSMAIRHVGHALDRILKALRREIARYPHLNGQVVVSDPQAIDAVDAGDLVEVLQSRRRFDLRD